jgi:hypothetical protein
MANTFLPFTAKRGFDLSFHALPLNTRCEFIRISRRLGASKEEKLATRQTEGRTGRTRARKHACGEPAAFVMPDHTLRHRRIAVPPAELSAR